MVRIVERIALGAPRFRPRQWGPTGRAAGAVLLRLRDLVDLTRLLHSTPRIHHRPCHADHITTKPRGPPAANPRSLTAPRSALVQQSAWRRTLRRTCQPSRARSLKGPAIYLEKEPRSFIAMPSQKQTRRRIFYLTDSRFLNWTNQSVLLPRHPSSLRARSPLFPN